MKNIFIWKIWNYFFSLELKHHISVIYCQQYIKDRYHEPTVFLWLHFSTGGYKDKIYEKKECFWCKNVLFHYRILVDCNKQIMFWFRLQWKFPSLEKNQVFLAQKSLQWLKKRQFFLITELNSLGWSSGLCLQ